MGYGTDAMSDFMIYPAASDSKRTFSFNVEASVVNTHTLLGSGYLLNTGIDDSGYIHGYVLYLVYEGNSNNQLTGNVTAYIYKINNNVKATDLAGWDNVQHPFNNYVGSPLQTYSFKMNLTSKKMRITAELTSDKVTVQLQNYANNGTDFEDTINLFNGSVALEKTGYNGVGPIVAYKQHGCHALSAFTYSDVVMTYDANAFNTLEGAQYYEGAKQKYFINLATQDGDSNLSDNADTYNTGIKRLNDNKIFYISNANDGKVLSNKITEEDGSEHWFTETLKDGTEATWYGLTSENGLYATNSDYITQIAEYIVQNYNDNVQFKQQTYDNPLPIADCYLVNLDRLPSEVQQVMTIHQQHMKDGETVKVGMSSWVETSANGETTTRTSDKSQHSNAGKAITGYKYRIIDPNNNLVLDRTDSWQTNYDDFYYSFNNKSIAGKWTFELTVQDDSGAESAAFQTYLTVFEDDQAPKISVSNVPTSSSNLGKAKITLTDQGYGIEKDGITLTENKGSGVAAYFVGGKGETPGDDDWTLIDDPSHEYSFTVNTEDYIDTGMCVWARDECGNVNTSTVFTVCHVTELNEEFEEFADYYVISGIELGDLPSPEKETYVDSEGTTYAFTGWYSYDYDSSNAKYPISENTVISNTTSFTIYPVYGNDTGHLVFNANGGQIDSATGGVASYDTEKATYEDVPEGISLTSALNTYQKSVSVSKTGYEFTGWTYEASGTPITTQRIIKYLEEPVVEETDTEGTEDGQEDSKLETLAFGSWGSSSGFGSWNQNNNSSNTGTTETTKTVGDGVEISVIDTEEDESEEEKFIKEYGYNYENNVYAQWQICSYKLIFDANGGKNGATSSKTEEYQADVVKDVLAAAEGRYAPTRAGYKFKGWTTVKDDESTLIKSGQTLAMSAGNMTVYALWEFDTSKFIITYSSGVDDPNATADQTQAYSAATASTFASVPSAARSGYSFEGWFTEDGTQITDGVSTNISQVGMKNVTVYAKWAPVDTNYYVRYWISTGEYTVKKLYEVANNSTQTAEEIAKEANESQEINNEGEIDNKNLTEVSGTDSENDQNQDSAIITEATDDEDANNDTTSQSGSDLGANNSGSAQSGSDETVTKDVAVVEEQPEGPYIEVREYTYVASALKKTYSAKTETVVSVPEEAYTGDNAVITVDGQRYWYNADKTAEVNKTTGTVIGSPFLELEVYYDRYLNVTSTSDPTGGTVDFSGATDIKDGEAATVTWTPDEGYYVAQVLVDGAYRDDLVNAGKVVFEDMAANHTVDVVFVKEGEAVSSTGGGTSTSGSYCTVTTKLKGCTGSCYITPTQRKAVGSNAAVQLTLADSNCYVESVTFDGVEMTDYSALLSDSGMLFANLTANHTIVVELGNMPSLGGTSTPGKYTITVNRYGAGNDVSLSPTTVVNSGETLKIYWKGTVGDTTYGPGNNYTITKVLVDGVSVNQNGKAYSDVGYYNFKSVSANHVVDVYYQAVSDSATTGSTGATGGSAGTEEGGENGTNTSGGTSGTTGGGTGNEQGGGTGNEQGGSTETGTGNGGKSIVVTTKPDTTDDGTGNGTGNGNGGTGSTGGTNGNTGNTGSTEGQGGSTGTSDGDGSTTGGSTDTSGTDSYLNCLAVNTKIVGGPGTIDGSAFLAEGQSYDVSWSINDGSNLDPDDENYSSYKVKSITVNTADGGKTTYKDDAVDGISSVNVTNIASNVEITVTLEALKHKVTISKSGPGTVGRSSTSVWDGQNYTGISITPNAGCVISKVVINGDTYTDLRAAAAAAKKDDNVETLDATLLSLLSDEDKTETKEIDYSDDGGYSYANINLNNISSDKLIQVYFEAVSTAKGALVETTSSDPQTPEAEDPGQTKGTPITKEPRTFVEEQTTSTDDDTTDNSTTPGSDNETSSENTNDGEEGDNAGDGSTTTKYVINVDTNGDGIPDLNVDTDNDGKPDLNVDLNNDGIPDINIVVNDDGTLNTDIKPDESGNYPKPTVNVDTDDDNWPDLNVTANGYDDDPQPVTKKDESGNPVTDDDGNPVYVFVPVSNIVDTDGNGEPDEIDIQAIDKGTPAPKPTVNIDSDGDGLPDVNVDTDGDGKPDLNIVYTEKDGVPVVDPDPYNPDGSVKTPTVNVVDYDHDGKPDTYVYDKNGDPKTPNTNVDIDGDGDPDLNVDTDNDGKPDLNIVDKNGDGIPDLNVFDENGNPLTPNVNVDTTNDGKPDTNVDSDNDGIPDINIVDTDHNGQPDTDIYVTGEDGKVTPINPNINLVGIDETTGEPVKDNVVKEEDGKKTYSQPKYNVDVDGDGNGDLNIIKTDDKGEPVLEDGKVVIDVPSTDGLVPDKPEDLLKIIDKFTKKETITVSGNVVMYDQNNQEVAIDGDSTVTVKATAGDDGDQGITESGAANTLTLSWTEPTGTTTTSIVVYDSNGHKLETIDGSAVTRDRSGKNPTCTIGGYTQDVTFEVLCVADTYSTMATVGSAQSSLNVTARIEGASVGTSITESGQVPMNGSKDIRYEIPDSYQVNYIVANGNLVWANNSAYPAVSSPYTLTNITEDTDVVFYIAPVDKVSTNVKINGTTINADRNGDGIPDANIDENNDGIPDSKLDKNGNGIPDEDEVYDTSTTNIDTNGNGKPDINLDTNGDGNPDANVDTTGNGVPDLNIVDPDYDGIPLIDFDPDDLSSAIPTVNIDVDGDGVPDVSVDTTGNGIPDVNVDTNGDGIPDVNIDTDGDGVPDLNIVDHNSDGKPDADLNPSAGTITPDVNIDTSGDGKPDVNVDTTADGVPDVNIDTTGDGKPDLNIVDSDYDGIPDAEIDLSNPDGIIPTVNIDVDGDGQPDVNVDVTGTGIPDINIDVDGDGVPDVNIDTDGDGVADLNVIDKNGDGIPDTDLNLLTDDLTPDYNIDTDGDGIADTNLLGQISITNDQNGEGVTGETADGGNTNGDSTDGAGSTNGAAAGALAQTGDTPAALALSVSGAGLALLALLAIAARKRTQAQPQHRPTARKH
jgi:uncharacterized repeat protein (TIGR02543 family)